MTKLTGTDIAKAFEQLAAEQSEQAQSAYALLIAKLVGAFTLKYQIPVQSGAVSSISRILKRLDDDAIRQVRAMSELLLRTDESTLRADLEELQAQLLPVGAQTHQLKTRSAFIATVLRPFDYKFVRRWLDERTDLAPETVKIRIEELERAVLTSNDTVKPWSEKVLELFNDIVVYKGEDSSQYYLRPAGTISPKSSRTYAQAWSAFVERYGSQAFEIARENNNEPEKELDSMWQMPSRDESILSLALSSAPEEEPGLAQALPASRESFWKPQPDAEVPVSLAMSAPPRSPSAKQSPSRVRNSWIKVDLESRINPSAQASRKWDNLEAFSSSLANWLESVEIIWGEASQEISAKVSVKTSNGEADLTIPRVFIADAKEKISRTAELLRDN